MNVLVSPSFAAGADALEVFDEGKTTWEQWESVPGFSNDGVVVPCEVNTEPYSYNGFAIHRAFGQSNAAADLEAFEEAAFELFEAMEVDPSLRDADWTFADEATAFGFDGFLRLREGIERYFNPEEDTWYLSRLCGTFKERLGWHPCQLPEALLERIIKLSSNENDVVFDPFTGSGTTLAVAARLDRQWLGCELSEEYAAKATERIEHAADTGETMQTTLADKGIKKGKPKKKAEPHRSPQLAKRRITTSWSMPNTSKRITIPPTFRGIRSRLRSCTRSPAKPAMRMPFS